MCQLNNKVLIDIPYFELIAFYKWDFKSRLIPRKRSPFLNNFVYQTGMCKRMCKFSNSVVFRLYHDF
jgi:hypothetical protein